MTTRSPSIRWSVVCFLLSILLAIQSLEATVFTDFWCIESRFIAGTPHRCLCFTGPGHAPTDTCAKWIPTAGGNYEVKNITCEANPGHECNYAPWTYSCGIVWNCPGFDSTCSDYATLEQTDATTLASWNCVATTKGSCGIAYGECALP